MTKHQLLAPLAGNDVGLCVVLRQLDHCSFMICEMRWQRAAALGVIRPAYSEVSVPAMPKRANSSASRRPPPGASPVGSGHGESAGATSVVKFAALSEAQWQAIRSTRNWPDGTDWRSRIEQAGRKFWETQAERKMWLEKELRGKPGEARKKVDGVLRLTHQLQKAWAASRSIHSD